MAYLIQILSLVLLLFYMVSGEDTSSDQDYNYRDTDAWKNIGECGGNRQSPIDFNDPIEFKVVDSECPVVNFVLYDSKPESMSIYNIGHTVQVNGTWPDNVHKQPTIEVNNEALSGSFRFVDFHLHWAEGDNNGSEHSFNGNRWTVELHALHLNNKYETDEEAFEAHDGILVYGYVFAFDDGPGDLDDLTEPLEKVREVGSEAELPKYSLNDLGLGCNQKFLSYQGSLTVPPCSENVRWLICTTPGTVAQSMLDNLRNVQLDYGDTNNVRPTQDLAGRQVYYLQCKKKRNE